MSATPSERLAALGLTLPDVAKPLAAYVPAVVVGNQVWTSGQLPLVDGALPQVGKVGAEVSPEDAADLARTAALNALAAIDAEVGLDNVTRAFKIVGFVASAPGFTGQPAVVNGASELIKEVLGGVHARSAVGVAELPMGTPVEIEVNVEFSS